MRLAGKNRKARIKISLKSSREIFFKQTLRKNTGCEKNPEIDFSIEIVNIDLVHQGEEYMKADWTWNKPLINRQNADVLGRAAHLAYKDPGTIGNELQEWEMQLVRFFDRQNTQAYLAKNDQTCILAFRGTQPNMIRDWLYDLDSRFVSAPKGMVGRVHVGFQNALNAIWPEVWTTLRKKSAAPAACGSQGTVSAEPWQYLPQPDYASQRPNPLMDCIPMDNHGSATWNFAPASIRVLVKVHFASSIITISCHESRSETWDTSTRASSSSST